MVQFGFFFDQSRCYGCHTCAIACKSWHNIPPGPVKFLRVYQYEKGIFPDLRIHFHWIPCYHCEEPVCINYCPEGAIYKDLKYGAVIIDKQKCSGCRICYDVCPYGAPVFQNDETGCKAQKCDMCYQRLQSGELPICVASCPVRALDFGLLDELMSRYGSRRDLPDMPDSALTKPAIIFKPHANKRKIIIYDSNKAIQLFMKRDPLPQLFYSIGDLLQIPEGLIGRNRLVIKHSSIDELMYFTRSDDG